MPGKFSLNDLRAYSPTELQAALAALSDDEADALLFDWSFWARANQLPPGGDWSTWLVLAGRGFGKTRTGAEWIRGAPQPFPGERLALVGATAADVRDVMVEGESGILACAPRGHRPLYEPSKRRVTWPNGALATCYSADEPERLRGPQHHRAWCDEPASWRRPEAWDMLMFGLRLGTHPRVCVTGTPKPVKLIRDLLKDPTCVVTRGSTYENRSNLAPAFFAKTIAKYEGTRLGRQELMAEVLDDAPGALWTRATVERNRVAKASDLVRIVVGIDPSVSSGEDSDECGLIVAGKGRDGHAYVLEDASERTSPGAWARKAIDLYHRHRADRIVAEVNNGGEMVELTLRTIDAAASYTAVHASRGKRTRAEPIAALYEQGRIHHVGAKFEHLEDQLCTWMPEDEDSPDRLDAAVWALTELMLEDDGFQPGAWK